MPGGTRDGQGQRQSGSVALPGCSGGPVMVSESPKRASEQFQRVRVRRRGQREVREEAGWWPAPRSRSAWHWTGSLPTLLPWACSADPACARTRLRHGTDFIRTGTIPRSATTCRGASQTLVAVQDLSPKPPRSPFSLAESASELCEAALQAFWLCAQHNRQELGKNSAVTRSQS
ncbi:hypothetical protein RTBOTA2_004968, partial [Rhodotorula toruloides]